MKLEDIGFLEVIENRARSISPGKVSYCEWIITSKCNFKCPYCNSLPENKVPANISLDKAKEIIDILAGMSCKYVHITGGEPTTLSNLPEIISYLKSKGIRSGLSSNGSRTLNYYQNLISCGTELFSLSLDIHKKELNKKFTLVSNNVFDTVVRNIRELSKEVYVNVGIVLNDDNIEYANDVIEFVSELGVHDIRIMTATKYNQINKLDIRQELLDKHKILKYRVNNFNEGKNIRGSHLGRSRKCHLVRDDITIAGEDYYPCAVYAREGGEPIGKFGPDNEQGRMKWFMEHNSYEDEICKKFCMDFKCRFNEKVEYWKITHR